MRISVDLRFLFKCFQWVIFPLAVFLGTAAHSQSDRVKEAQKLAKEEKWSEVVNSLKAEAVSLDRKGKLLLANAYMKTNNTPGQVQVLNSVIAENDKDYEALVLLGETHLRASPKNNDEAALSFRNALVAKKDYLPAYKGLIEVYENTKNNYELRILYLDMIKFLGEKPEFISSLCRLDSQDGFLDTARKWCNKGMLLDPNNADNQVYLGISLRDSGQEKQAIQILKKAADTFAKSDLAQLKYADFLAEKKDNLGALKYYQRATDANSKLAPAWDGLAHAALALQKYEISVKAFEQACKLDRSVLTKVRKALAVVRRAPDKQWTDNFETVASECGLHK